MTKQEVLDCLMERCPRKPTKVRSAGLSNKLDRLKKLQEEVKQVWEDVQNTCTHAEKDLEIDSFSVDDTLGNSTRYSTYTLKCKVCLKHLARRNTDGRGYWI
jgi:hypothetical protein